MASNRLSRAETHATVRASLPYQEQVRQLNALTNGFLHALHLAWVTSTRDLASRESLFWRFIDDMVSSAVGIASLVEDGIDRIARRELRFMLELAIRNLYVDAWFSRETPLSVRMAYVERKLGQEDVRLLDKMPLSQYLADPAAFKQTTRRLYGELSEYTHPSHEQLARRLEEAERGVFIGFETAAELASFTDLLRRTYDMVLVFVFEALGFSSTGDLYIEALDGLRNWPFHQTTYMTEVGRTFDYKVERQPKASEVSP